MLNYILKMMGAKVWCGFKRLSIESSSRLLCTR